MPKPEYPVVPWMGVVAPSYRESTMWCRHMNVPMPDRWYIAPQHYEKLLGRDRLHLVVLDWDRMPDPRWLTTCLCNIRDLDIDYRSLDADFGVRRPRPLYTDLLSQQSRLERLIEELRALGASNQWGLDYFSVTTNRYTAQRITDILGNEAPPMHISDALRDNDVRVVKMAKWTSAMDD